MKERETVIKKENREVKNSVFVDLFCYDETAEKNVIALYNALHDEPLPSDVYIRKLQVDNVLYMTLCNDVSFGIDDKVMVFAEHQSTINKNMPLRSLLYVGRAYEKLVPDDSRYRKKQVKIPQPEFYTFYNGRSKWYKDAVLRLSDAYADSKKENMLELKVRVININREEQHEVLERCPVLKEYSLFIECVRKYQDAKDSEAYKKAISECIQKGILSEYLSRKGSEVINMLLGDYNYDDDIRIQREEEREDVLDVCAKLLANGREDEIMKAASDKLYREKLFKEFVTV